jgi:nicotinate-nucleotide adenylyltransferase
MRVGLYFGSFNPVHVGHLIIANFVVQNTDLEQVWFVISPQNPLKKSSSLLNEYHRLYLVQVSIEDEPALRASDIEFRLPKPSYTIDTLTYLAEKFPGHQFSVIMGSDSYQNLEAWKNYQQLLAEYPLIIYERPGSKVQKKHNVESTTFLKAPLLEISSTHIRETIKQGKSIRYLVTDKVKSEIEQNGYYK